uniref:Uncharacterized protein n=1 Tax=Glossina palpalis gambiensis TaxID=67801 RepID=A0A1B0APS1_9MUSC
MSWFKEEFTQLSLHVGRGYQNVSRLLNKRMVNKNRSKLSVGGRGGVGGIGVGAFITLYNNSHSPLRHHNGSMAK